MSSAPPEKSFAALFEETRQGPQRTRRGRVGETFDVVVVQVGRDAIFVEFGDHQQGMVDPALLRDAEGNLRTAIGGVFRARVVQAGGEEDAVLAPIAVPIAVTDTGVAPDANTAAAAGPVAEVAGALVAVGQRVSGEVSRVEAYGVFVQIEGTKGRAGRGLIPVSELGTARGVDLRKAFPLGTKLRSKVIDVGQGKIRLSVRGLKDDEERAEFDGFREKGTTEPAQGFGTFGDLLRARKGK